MRLSKNAQLTLGLWLPMAVAITLSMAVGFWAVLQNYRLTANDPQIQIAHDSLLDLAQVPDLAQIAGAFGKVDISKTYNAFLVVYDEQKKPVAGNGNLDDKLPELPSGVFDSAKKLGENRFTWQPNKTLRFAAILRPFNGQQSGYILVARSLEETEKREQMLTIGVAIAWALAMLLALALSSSLSKWLIKHFAAHDHAHEIHHTA